MTSFEVGYSNDQINFVLAAVGFAFAFAAGLLDKPKLNGVTAVCLLAIEVVDKYRDGYVPA